MPGVEALFAKFVSDLNRPGARKRPHRREKARARKTRARAQAPGRTKSPRKTAKSPAQPGIKPGAGKYLAEASNPREESAREK